MLLNANVAFLAIPSVDPGGHTRTPAQLASYLSTIASIGSVVTGLLLLRQYRTKPRDSAEEVVSHPIHPPHPSLYSLRSYSLSSCNRATTSEVAIVIPSGSKLLRSYTAYRIRYCSGRELVIVTTSVSLTSFIDSTIAFLSAFGLEALLFSSELWTRLPVGVVLTIIVLLISWCVWTRLAAKGNISLLSIIDDLTVCLFYFARPLRGKTSDSGSRAGGAGDGDDQCEVGMLSHFGTLKEAFNRFRLQRPRASPTGINGHVPPDVTTVEMSETNNNPPESVV